MTNEIIFIDGVSIDEKNDVNSFLANWHNSDDYILAYTSGSTGKPKEIRLKKSAMIASAQATGNFFRFKKNQKMLLCLSPKYIAGMMQIVRAEMFNMQLVVAPVTSNPLIEDNSNQIDFAAFVPLQIEAILSDTQSTKRFKKIKNVIIGGAALNHSVKEKIYLLNNDVYLTFGMTETVSHIALNKVEKGNDKYCAFPKIKLSVTTENCLVIDAPSIHTELIYTTDIVELIDSKCFKWKGRADFVINSGGVKIHPEIVENKIGDIIKDTYYISKQSDERFGEKVVLFIESSAYKQDKEQKIMNCLRNVLDQYEMPKTIIFKKEFTRSFTGKIIRNKFIQ